MKRTNCVYYVLVCMLLCFTACDKDNSSIEDEIPAAIESDFSKRSPSAEITAFNNHSNNILTKSKTRHPLGTTTKTGK